jgi:lactate dehydrogenase-like 2-hydroxyacid dehydrogenase
VLVAAAVKRLKLVQYDPLPLSREREHDLRVRRLGLDQLLRVADAVTVHVALNAQTRHLIDAESLSIMKSSAVLVNTARGGVVDETALADALLRVAFWARVSTPSAKSRRQ